MLSTLSATVHDFQKIQFSELLQRQREVGAVRSFSSSSSTTASPSSSMPCPPCTLQHSFLATARHGQEPPPPSAVSPSQTRPPPLPSFPPLLVSSPRAPAATRRSSSSPNHCRKPPASHRTVGANSPPPEHPSVTSTPILSPTSPASSNLPRASTPPSRSRIRREHRPEPPTGHIHCAAVVSHSGHRRDPIKRPPRAPHSLRITSPPSLATPRASNRAQGPLLPQLRPPPRRLGPRSIRRLHTTSASKTSQNTSPHPLSPIPHLNLKQGSLSGELHNSPNHLPPSSSSSPFR